MDNRRLAPPPIHLSHAPYCSTNPPIVLLQAAIVSRLKSTLARPLSSGIDQHGLRPASLLFPALPHGLPLLYILGYPSLLFPVINLGQSDRMTGRQTIGHWSRLQTAHLIDG